MKSIVKDNSDTSGLAFLKVLKWSINVIWILSWWPDEILNHSSCAIPAHPQTPSRVHVAVLHPPITITTMIRPTSIPLYPLTTCPQDNKQKGLSSGILNSWSWGQPLPPTWLEAAGLQGYTHRMRRPLVRGVLSPERQLPDSEAALRRNESEVSNCPSNESPKT